MTPFPWSPPPPLPKPGDGILSPLYRQVGWALTQWEGFEFWCGVLYLHLFPKVSGDLDYGRSKQYEARLGFLDRAEALKHEFSVRHCNQENESRLCRLLDEAARFSERRNDIAHGAVRYVGHTRHSHEGRYPGFSTSAGLGYFIVPISGFDRRFGATPTKLFSAYTSAEIRFYGEQFTKLIRELRLFLRDVFDVPLLPP